MSKELLKRLYDQYDNMVGFDLNDPLKLAIEAELAKPCEPVALTNEIVEELAPHTDLPKNSAKFLIRMIERSVLKANGIGGDE